MKSLRQKLAQQRGGVLTVGFMLLALLLLPMQTVAALSTSSVTMSDPRPGATAVTYDYLTSGVTTAPIKCIRVEFDTASDGTGGKPTSLDITSAALSGTSDYIPTPASWSVSNNNTTGVSSITFGTGETPASAAARNTVLTGITNGNTAGTAYFLIVNTYNNTDCATSPVDNGTIAFIYTNGQAVSMSIDPTLAFSIAGVTGNGVLTVNGAVITNTLATTSTTIPLGVVTTAANKIAAQDLTVSTNAGSGFTVYTRYTAQPTSGANTISDVSGSNAAPAAFSAAGTEAFGYTTEDATLSGTADRFTSSGGNKWAAFTTSNAELLFSSAPVSSQTTRVGYQAGIASTTDTGTYTTTVVLTAVPIY